MMLPQFSLLGFLLSQPPGILPCSDDTPPVAETSFDFGVDDLAFSLELRAGDVEASLAGSVDSAGDGTCSFTIEGVTVTRVTVAGGELVEQWTDLSQIDPDAAMALICGLMNLR